MDKLKQWHVYIVKCSDGTLYTGITTDIVQRVAKHNSGAGAKYTRSRRPVQLVYQESVDTKSQALKREAAIKRLRRVEKLELIVLS